MKNLSILFVFIIMTLFSNNTKAAVPIPPSLSDSLIAQAFDVVSYNLSLDLTDYVNQYANGVCDIKFVWNKDPKENLFYFNLRNMTIDSVKYDGYLSEYKSDYTQENDSIFSMSGKTSEIGDTVTVTVYYKGKMIQEEINGWGGVKYSNGILYTMGVGLVNDFVGCTRYWMPCYDHPSDKALFKAVYIVPKGVSAASTGKYMGRSISNSAVDSVFWESKDQCATYLLTFAVSNFKTIENSYNNKKVNIFYNTNIVDSTDVNYSFLTLNRMLDMMHNLTGVEYPFESIGYIIAPTGSMEHQTMITLVSSIVKGSKNRKDSADITILHELSHQWFGDLITPYDFRHAWLNESFAAYCESLWIEQLYGHKKYLNKLKNDASYYLHYALSDGALVPLYNFQAYTNHNYPLAIYNKGAVIMGMLRYELGDSTFFDILKTYTQKFADKNVITQDYIDIVNEKSNQNMDWFFDQWIYRPAYPVLNVNIDFELTQTGKKAKSVIISQKNLDSTSFYKKLPVEIGFLQNNGTYIYKIFTMNAPEQEFLLDEEIEFVSVTINSGENIVSMFDVSNLVYTSVEENLTDISPAVSIENQSALIKMKDCINCSSVKIYDMLGNLIDEVKVNYRTQFNYNMSTYSKGAYLFIFEDVEKTYTVKVII